MMIFHCHVSWLEGRPLCCLEVFLQASQVVPTTGDLGPKGLIPLTGQVLPTRKTHNLTVPKYSRIMPYLNKLRFQLSKKKVGRLFRPLNDSKQTRPDLSPGMVRSIAGLAFVVAGWISDVSPNMVISDGMVWATICKRKRPTSAALIWTLN